MTPIIPQSSGIYKITCTANGKIYIGSSVNLQKRWKEHQRNMRGNYHPNPHLQAAFNKYGETSFSFSVVELVDDEYLIEREQYWLDHFNPISPIGFNIALNAQAPMKGRKASVETRAKIGLATTLREAGFKGKHHTIEAREKMSQIAKTRTRSNETRIKQANSMRGKKHSSETKLKMSRASKGRKKNPEAVAKSAMSKSKLWFVITPNGEEIIIRNLREFCSQNKLSRVYMWEVAAGRREQYKGWKCRYV